ncbi:MAG: YCF48-related protein [Bacteriovoracaceae bacterium]|nr:YCF48-related protein [Bacteroidota bacterium]
MKSLLRIFLCIPVLLQAQWIQQDGNTTENLVGIAILDSHHIVAIGDRNAILRTTDAGTVWVNQTMHISASYDWNDLSFSDSVNGVLVGDRMIMTTTDGGISWTVRNNPSLQQYLSVIQTGPGTLIIGTDSGYVHASLDTGNTWTSEKISEWPIQTLFPWRGTIAPGLPVYYALTPYSVCAKSILPSPSWKETMLPMFAALGSGGVDAEFCNGGETGFIVGVFGDLRAQPAILRKTVSDTAWMNVQLISLQDGVLCGISAPSTAVAYACGSAGMMFKSTTGGDSWSAVSVPTKRGLRAVHFYDEQHGFAVGDSGTILYTSQGGTVDVKDKQTILPDAYELLQNFPNPFNSSTTIRFKIPVRTFVTVSIFDLLGRKSETLAHATMEAGEHSIQWQARDASSGMYVYRLTTEKACINKAMVLLR